MLNQYGFVRIAATSPALRVGDVAYNTKQTIHHLKKAEQQGAAVALFPELGLTGYTCGDLFLQPILQQAAMDGLLQVAAEVSSVVAIVGLPVMAQGRLFNCAAVVQRGRVLGIVPKINIPNHQEFNEKRWFASGSGVQSEVVIDGDCVPFGPDLLFCCDDGSFTFGIELGEDPRAPNSPSATLAQRGAQILFNPSADAEAVAKHAYRRNLIKMQSGLCIASYVYAGAGLGESTTDMVFGGYTCIAENGRILTEGERFRRDVQVCADIDIDRLNFQRTRNSCFYPIDECTEGRTVRFPLSVHGDLPLRRYYTAWPFLPTDAEEDARFIEITAIQVAALRKRMEHTGQKKAVVNVSGGLDSALTLLIAARLFREQGWNSADLHTLTLPGFGTGERTRNNALGLMQQLGCTVREIDITEAVRRHFDDIGHDENIHDVTYENAQARERTQILFDYSNRIGALALGTGDLSEMALGWSTFNGDHMSMYNVNSGVPKTLVRHLVRWLSVHHFSPEVAHITADIVDTPVSPELLPSREGKIDQRTEDILGPYELHDFFLYHMSQGGASPSKLMLLAVHAFGDLYPQELIGKTLRTFITRFFSQQFKRSCVPDGPKIGSVALSPRGDWRMPSDASAAVWLAELDTL